MIITFTGHRPDKLGGYDFFSPLNNEIRKYFGNFLNKYIRNYTNIQFITGGAIGFDQMAFHICKILRDDIYTKESIILELAVPFKKQYMMWNDVDKQRHFEHIKLADKVTEVDTLEKYKCDKVPIEWYHRDKMQLRNMYMVDNADLVIALWNNSKGGTANCINYAKKLKKEVIIINPSIFSKVEAF